MVAESDALSGSDVSTRNGANWSRTAMEISELIWWDGVSRSLGSDLFLALRQRGVWSGRTMVRRLSLGESSSGSFSSYADSWIRAETFDLNPLLERLEKSRSLVVLDLLPFLLAGVPESQILSWVNETARRSARLIVLFPLFDCSLREKIEGQHQTERKQERHLTRSLFGALGNVRRVYEGLLNSDVRFGMIETSLCYQDFAHFVGVEEGQGARVLGFLGLLPRILCEGTYAFADCSEVLDVLVHEISRVERGENGLMHQAVFPKRRERFVTTSHPQTGLVRRIDGVLAVRISWERWRASAEKIELSRREAGMPGTAGQFWRTILGESPDAAGLGFDLLCVLHLAAETMPGRQAKRRLSLHSAV